MISLMNIIWVLIYLGIGMAIYYVVTCYYMDNSKEELLPSILLLFFWPLGVLLLGGMWVIDFIMEEIRRDDS